MQDQLADLAFMARALRLAERGRTSTKPNPRVGCVIVRAGQVLGEGFHHHAGGPHAERVALAAAGGAARGATAYVTLEPCCHHGRTPPCTEGLIEAGISRVVFADGDTNPRVDGNGAAQLRAAGIMVEGGLMAADAHRLNRGFHSRFQRGRPFVTLKLGMSLDGKVALANGASQWITGADARADVQRLRAQSCAVLTGIGTVLADNPRLTVRDGRFDLAGRQPLRIVLDRQLRTPPHARVLAEEGGCIVMTTSADQPAAAALREAGAALEVVGQRGTGLDLAQVLARLGQRECNDVLVETGPVLAGAFIDSGLVDELVVYLAPVILGAGARSAFATPLLTSLDEAASWEVLETRSIGADLRVTARPSLA